MRCTSEGTKACKEAKAKLGNGRPFCLHHWRISRGKREEFPFLGKTLFWRTLSKNSEAVGSRGASEESDEPGGPMRLKAAERKVHQWVQQH